MRKNLLVCLGLLLTTLALGACSNTFEGMGRDTENVGEWMQDTF